MLRSAPSNDRVHSRLHSRSKKLRASFARGDLAALTAFTGSIFTNHCRSRWVDQSAVRMLNSRCLTSRPRVAAGSSSGSASPAGPPSRGLLERRATHSTVVPAKCCRRAPASRSRRQTVGYGLERLLSPPPPPLPLGTAHRSKLPPFVVADLQRSRVCVASSDECKPMNSVECRCVYWPDALPGRGRLHWEGARTAPSPRCRHACR
jgi:hypothetical protein